MKAISLKDLMEAGCHFGHQTTRWNPKMRPFIYTARDRIHIFDLVQTKDGLEKAGEFVKNAVAAGGQVIFIGTKRQSQDIIKAAAEKVTMPYVIERWIGGLITNWSEVKQRIKLMEDLISGQANNQFADRTKKERLMIDKQILKLQRHFGGVSMLKDIPAAIFVADAHKNVSSLLEAKRYGVATIAIADTNANPDLIDFPIPANDDASKSVELIVNYMIEAIEEGKKMAVVAKDKAEKSAEAAKEKETKKKAKK